ncbi:MAG: hypothetical protein ABR909_13840 [Candidatus Bathyarchaeia archaeon]|jgi:hypothetical protein
MGNKEVLDAVELVLRMQTHYGLSVEYDAEGNPIMKVAPIVKVKPNDS